MKRAVSCVVIVLLVAPLLAGCAGPVGERMKQGAVIGGAAGALGGYGAGGGGKTAALGAAAGMILGAAVGAVVGMSEAKMVLAEPQPLPWLTGDGEPKSIQVVGRRGWGGGMDVVTPVIEEQLKRRGGVVVRNPGPQYYPFKPGSPETTATDFVAEVNIIERYGAVTLDLQVFNPARQLVASAPETVPFGTVGHYTSDDRIAALRTAARNAVWKLH